MVIRYEEGRAAPQGLTGHVGQAVGFALTMYQQLHRPCQPASPQPLPSSVVSQLLPPTHWDAKISKRDEKAKQM